MKCLHNNKSIILYKLLKVYTCIKDKKVQDQTVHRLRENFKYPSNQKMKKRTALKMRKSDQKPVTNGRNSLLSEFAQ